MFLLTFLRYLLQRINLSCLTVIKKKNVSLRRLDVINYSSHGSLRTIIANFRSRRVPSFPSSHLILRSYFFTQLPLLPPSPPSPSGRDRRKSCASRRTSGSVATREYESYDISRREDALRVTARKYFSPAIVLFLFT